MSLFCAEIIHHGKNPYKSWINLFLELCNWIYVIMWYFLCLVTIIIFSCLGPFMIYMWKSWTARLYIFSLWLTNVLVFVHNYWLLSSYLFSWFLDAPIDIVVLYLIFILQIFYWFLFFSCWIFFSLWVLRELFYGVSNYGCLLLKSCPVVLHNLILE